jgi:hypothetical protein
VSPKPWYLSVKLHGVTSQKTGTSTQSCLLYLTTAGCVVSWPCSAAQLVWSDSSNVNTRNEPTGSGNRRLSDKIMTSKSAIK